VRVGLVACSARKLAHPAPARELYQGTLYKLARRVAEQRCDDWRILSALHGLLDPERTTAPYNARLAGLTAAQYAEWRERVAAALRREYPAATFVVMAGAEYRAAVHGGEVIPGGMERLGIGAQTRRLKEVAMREREVLVVGVAPSRSAGARGALLGSSSGAHLETLLGLQRGELGAVADTANLHPAYPGPARAGNGDAEPPPEALREAATNLDLAGYRRLILCGRAVAEAFGLRYSPLAAAEVRGVPALVIPHPSRVSRWRNDPANVAAASDALREFAPLARRLA
jgi:hypothetical protein